MILAQKTNLNLASVVFQNLRQTVAIHFVSNPNKREITFDKPTCLRFINLQLSILGVYELYLDLLESTMVKQLIFTINCD